MIIHRTYHSLYAALCVGTSESECMYLCSDVGHRTKAAVGHWAKFQGFLSSVEWEGRSYLDGRFWRRLRQKHFHIIYIIYNNIIIFYYKKKLPYILLYLLKGTTSYLKYHTVK